MDNIKESKNNSETKIYALGGLDEVGKNMYCIEHNEEIIIIDAGVRFAEDELPGIDYVIPDYTYLVKNRHKIKGLFITHGHEDHIGGIPFLLLTVDVPMIYATEFATALIKKKLDERRLTRKTHFNMINDKSNIKTKYFKISFFATNHSIPESQGIIIDTPNGRIVQTGDFKFDFTPIGNHSDLHKMAKIGGEGVTLLMSDSTNSEVPQFSISEKKVANSIMDLFRKIDGRIFIATFASNVHRVQQIIEVSVKLKRKILVFGRSMENNIEISRKLGYIKIPDSSLVNAEEAKRLKHSELVIICTGSQGETMAALSRMANGTHKSISIVPGDTVVFSSNPIPGNSLSIGRIVNLLFRRGANVITNSPLNSLHTSGHASQEEQKLMLLLFKPKYFLPMHGEYRMLKIHAQLAEEVGVAQGNTFIFSNGDVLKMKDGVCYPGGRIQADDIYVDGNDASGLSTSVLRDRKLLSEDGLVAVLVTMDSRTNRLLSKPVIISRGFVYMKESAALIREAELRVQNALNEMFLSEKISFGEIKNTVKETLGSYFYIRTKRNPMIIPVIMNKRWQKEN